MNPPTFASADDLEAHLRALEHSPSDEAGLTELEHLLQCADVLRETAPDDLELQLAGLVHDIGSAPEGDAEHGEIGAAAVRGLLGERVAELVRLHVDAKRYLVTRDEGYRSRLSPVSVRTLMLQGEAMTSEQAAAFEEGPHFEDAVRLRRADDLAKTPGKPTSNLSSWRPALEAVTYAQAGRRS